MQHLRRKLTLRAHGEQVVFVKREHERIEHVWMKAFLWALYLPSYRGLSVEISIDDKYKPEVVALDRCRSAPIFPLDDHASNHTFEVLKSRLPASSRVPAVPSNRALSKNTASPCRPTRRILRRN